MSLFSLPWRAGDAGDGTISNDAPFAHWTAAYSTIQAANTHTCAVADSSSSYDTYTGLAPWEEDETGTTNSTADMQDPVKFAAADGQNK